MLFFVYFFLFAIRFRAYFHAGEKAEPQMLKMHNKGQSKHQYHGHQGAQSLALTLTVTLAMLMRQRC